MAALLLAALGLGRAIAARLGEMTVAATRAPSPGARPGVSGFAGDVLGLALPLLGAAAIAAFVAHVAQTRALFLPRREVAHAPAAPRDRDYRGVAFAAAIGGVAFGWLWRAAPALAAPDALPAAAITLVIAAAAIAALDAIARSVRHTQALRMTAQDRREDARLAGADPRWRELRAKLANDPALDVARASLVLLGDGVAAAIEYHPTRAPRPRVVASGQLLGLARRYAIPVQRDAALAALPVGDVPERHWPRLAEIVAAVSSR